MGVCLDYTLVGKLCYLLLSVSQHAGVYFQVVFTQRGSRITLCSPVFLKV